MTLHTQISVMADTIIDADLVDYLILATYFVFVLGIGLLARRHVSDSVDFFLSGRLLPAWVTGLAFISANLGAVEIMGMSASGAEFGLPTVHYFWVGAIPAMLFLGVVMMPFYYGSKLWSSPSSCSVGSGRGRTSSTRSPSRWPSCSSQVSTSSCSAPSSTRCSAGRSGWR